MNPSQFYAHKTDYNNAVEILFGHETPSGMTAAQPVTFSPVDRDDFNHVTPPTVKLHIRDAQKLIDALWQAGLRPSEGEGSAGAMKAVESHLADMRRIAFAQLGLERA